MLENNQKEIILLKDLGMYYATEKSTYKVRFGLYKCFCNNKFRARTADIKNEKIKSCGCIVKKILIKRNTNHNLSNHRIYSIWTDMKKRCFNKKRPNYNNYGGRGIMVCNEWKNDFLSFYNWSLQNGYKDNLTIDREDNDGNYEPTNCRWANRNTQARNKRKLMITNTSGYKGVTLKKETNKWNSFIMINNKRIHLGYFKDKLDAAKAYDQYVIDNNLEHTLNGVLT